MLLGIVGLSNGFLQPPGSGLKVWLSAGAGGTKTSSNVTKWADQSGNGNDFTPPAANPQFVASAINGQPALSFNGTSQYLTCPFQISGAKQVILVRKLTATPGSGVFTTPFQLSAPGNHFGTIVYICNSGAYKSVTFCDDVVATPTTPTAGANGVTLDTSWHVDEYTYNGLGNTDHTNYGFAQDATAFTVLGDNGEDDATPVTASSIGVDLGASNAPLGDWFNGSIAELLVYDHVLSGADETQARTYLEAKYGIALGAP